MSSQIDLELWKSQITTKLTEELTSEPMDTSDEDWEWLDSEMVKLGSLSHAQFEGERALLVAFQLLETRTKDIRVLIQLIRILQHGIRPKEVIASLVLLNEYISHFWASAFPIEAKKKIRFLEPVLKRYQSIWAKFENEASKNELQESNKIANMLKAFFEENDCPQIASYFEKMLSEPIVEPLENSNRQITNKSSNEKSKNEEYTISKNDPPANEGIQAINQQFIGLNPNDEKQFKQAQQTMANMLVELYADLPIGYRLRRHALWSTITSLPQANQEGKTPLAAMSIDLVDTYLNRISNPDIEIWKALEKSISMAPFWFDGHYISSYYAKKIGAESVAEAIREELKSFINRVKGIEKLKFNDNTPFLNEVTLAWLDDKSGQHNKNNQKLDLANNIPIQLDDDFSQIEDAIDQAFEAKLERLESETRDDIKGIFNLQLQLALELEAKGFHKLAKQQFSTLRLQLHHTTLSEWEADLIAFLEEKNQ